MIEANADIAGKIQRLKEIKSTLKGLKTEEDEIKRDVVTFMHDKETLTYLGDTLARYKQIVTTKFDSKRFGEDHPDLYAEYLTSSSYMKLS